MASAPSLKVSIKGTAQVGQTLQTVVEPVGENVTYQWQMADKASSTFSDISGATGRTHKLAADKAGKFVRVKVTSELSGAVYSTPTTAVSK